jgi:hypothetical protein
MPRKMIAKIEYADDKKMQIRHYKILPRQESYEITLYVNELHKNGVDSNLEKQVIYSLEKAAYENLLRPTNIDLIHEAIDISTNESLNIDYKLINSKEHIAFNKIQSLLNQFIKNNSSENLLEIYLSEPLHNLEWEKYLNEKEVI